MVRKDYVGIFDQDLIVFVVHLTRLETMTTFLWSLTLRNSLIYLFRFSFQGFTPTCALWVEVRPLS